MSELDTLKFELTAEQTVLYQEWLKNIVKLQTLEHENLDQVTISFTFTPWGQSIMAHTGSCNPTDGHQIVLHDL